jgi:hypothetical protein
MLAYITTLDNNGNIKEEFNLADFQKNTQGATLQDLLNYAGLYISNTFLGFNYFAKDITFGTYINNISSDTFNYLLNCRSNIQEQFNLLNVKQKIGRLFSGRIITNVLNCHVINGENFFCSNLHASNMAYVIFMNQNCSYPVLRSGEFSQINSFNTSMPIYVTIWPGYSLLIQNQMRVPLFSTINTGQEIKHYVSVGQFASGNLPYFFIIRRL